MSNSNPQTIGEVEGLIQRLRDAGEQNMGDAWNRNDIHSLGLGANLVEEAASTIEHQLSVIGELREELLNIRAAAYAGLRDADAGEMFQLIDTRAAKALSHPIIGGDK